MAIMEINNLPLVSSVNDTDLLVIETSKGTRAVTKSTLSPSTMIFSNVAPTDTNTCWIDISKGNMIKVYNSVTSTWENISNLSSPVIYYMADGVAIVKGLIYKYKDANDIIIPSEIDGVPVTAIGINSFNEYTNLTSITIPSTVTSIDKNAFNGCTALTTVYYTGTEKEWNAINIDTANDPLISATKVFNYGTPIQKLPVVSSSDSGKVLHVSTNGIWEIVTPERAQSYTATIGTTWEEDSETGVKYQVVAVSALTGADDEKAFVDHTDSSIDGTSDGYALFVEEENQYLEFITNGRAKTVAGGIRFEIFGDANTIEIPIEVRVG